MPLGINGCRSALEPGSLYPNPAPGYRGRGEGALGYVGSNGYSWSAASYDSGDHYRGLYLHFNTTGLNPSNTTYRAYGLQLRCLSE